VDTTVPEVVKLREWLAALEALLVDLPGMPAADAVQHAYALGEQSLSVLPRATDAALLVVRGSTPLSAMPELVGMPLPTISFRLNRIRTRLNLRLEWQKRTVQEATGDAQNT
jgi:hypothetical protein